MTRLLMPDNDDGRADQRAEEAAEEHGAVAIGVLEVGPAEQQE